MWSADGTGGIVPPAEVRKHLVMQLKPEWRFDAAGACFVSGEGEELAAAVDLPEGAEIVHMIPELAEAKREQLSGDELELSRYLHILLPGDSHPEEVLETVAAWKCVAETWLPPQVSLPGDGPP